MQEHSSAITTDVTLPNISEAKRQLLEKYLRGDVKQRSSSPRTIVPLVPGGVPQLSFAQERLWFLDQLNPGSAVYNVPLAVRLRGPIDPVVIERSVNEIVRRHEALRTTFPTVAGRAEPTLRSQLKIALQLQDLTSLPQDEREERSRALLVEECEALFDLTHGPLIRTTLVTIDPQEHVFLVVMHHIVSDGWSLVLFFQELAAIYDAFSSSEPSPLPEVAIQYADYAAWQRDWLQGDLLQRQLSYWKTQLGGELPVLELPVDRQRPAVQTHPGDRVTLALPADLTQAVMALSQREGATLFMTLLAAFKVLLHHYSGQEDIIVGSPIANRPVADTEKLIGFFLNNLALRTDLSGDPNFVELLSRVRKTALDAYANQDVPFEKLIEALKPERDMSRSSIFQVYFNLFSFSDQIELPGGEAISFVDAWLQSEENLSKFDLTLYAGVGDKEIKLGLVYNTDLFSHERIGEMLEQFRHLLEQIVERPTEEIKRLSLVTPGAQMLLPDPTEPFNAQPRESIQKLFSDQARRRPHQLAIVDPYESWTYQELDSRSNQLANYLRASGIEAHDTVAIYGHRSAPLVLAILGVLKAGAAFVILDPTYPASRLVNCLQIAAPRAFLQIDEAGALPDVLDQFVETLDCCCRLKLPASDNADQGGLVGYSFENPQVDTNSNDLAYIAFTSGSTGNPKGVMGRHGPLTLFTLWAAEKFGLNASDRFCMLSGLAHDPLHRDIFTPLQLGGSICIPEPSDLEAPQKLRAWMKQQRITVANLTPAMSQLLSETDTTTPDEQLESLRYSFLVGDVLTKRDVSRLKKIAPKITCVNLYGATESQRAVGYFVVQSEDEVFSEIERANTAEKEVLPLGKGIREVQLLVLNAAHQLCGIGEAGEIHFRSPHLARGYLGDETLTDERFIVNPFTKTTSDRLYRTGDLGRYLPDGNVEHLGRVDRQVKIRGFRIEPGEIEAVLTEHPDVRETAVVPQQNASGETYLVAYVVPAENSATTGELRQYLSEKVPAYMVPTAFVTLDALPLTPNRKLDRRALPIPDQVRQDRRSEFTAPRSAIEQTLANIWQEMLAVEQVGVHDNFFELGGHSLLAVRLFAVIEKKFGKRLPLATLFQAPTVAQVAALLKTESRSAAWSSLVPIQPLGPKQPFFCVHAVGGNVLEYYDLARLLGPDQPFYGLQSRGLDGQQQPHTRITEMAAHYIKEIREFQPEGPYLIGGRSLGGMIAFEMASQLKAAGQEVSLLALLDSYPVGYSKMKQNAGALSGTVRRTIRRLRAHVSNLRGFSFKEKSQYVLEKAQYAPIRFKSLLWRAIYRCYKNLGRALPRALRDVQEFNWLAAHSYVPHLYDGKVTLFWASRDVRASFDLVTGWRVLAGGGMDVHEIPGSHLDMIKEPHVSELAAKLKACLENAQ
ncbi:MAG TPA: amino acid adenylation domain-containing protein [Pyrinomonadaceae bacterium]|nr:amino acid adenylation domain-containing protein [Pyrinomonadaceae bacterium]